MALPIIIHFTYFLTLSEVDYPTKHTAYMENQNYHILDIDTRIFSQSYDKEEKIINTSVYKWFFYTNAKYQSYILYNINEIKNFIIIYLLISVIATYVIHKKRITSKFTNYIRHYSIISILSIFSLAFLFSDTKLYHEIESSHEFEKDISSMNAIKIVNNKMTLLQDVNSMPQNNFDEFKNKVDTFHHNLTSTFYIHSSMSNVSYYMLSKYIILAFSSDLIQVSQKIDNNQRNNGYYRVLSYYYDLLLMINVLLISLLLFSKNNKNLKGFKNTIICINIITIFYIFLSMLNINLMNIQENKKLLENITSMNEKNHIIKTREILNYISATYSIKSILFKNQILLLIFSFTMIQKEIIEKIKLLMKNDKFLFIITIITVFFLIQTLLVSTFNLFILFSIIVYLAFFLRDNIKIDKLNMFLIICFFTILLQELILFLFEQYYLNNINDLLNMFLSNSERDLDFMTKQNYNETEKLSKNKFFTEYYSKSFSILLAVLSYFLIQYSNILNIDKKTNKK